MNPLTPYNAKAWLKRLDRELTARGSCAKVQRW